MARASKRRVGHVAYRERVMQVKRVQYRVYIMIAIGSFGANVQAQVHLCRRLYRYRECVVCGIYLLMS